MRYTYAVAFIVALFTGAPAANATVRIAVDLTSQRMHVTSASGSYSWPISSARDGYRTPNGTFGVQSMAVMHRSKLYHNSPMPHSIFFAGGYAIHGTYSTGALGTPASHGCVRLSPGNAAALYRMVQNEGARITITGSAPHSYASHRRHRDDAYQYAYSRGYQEQPQAQDMFGMFGDGF